jgi:predicted ATPase
MIKKLYLEAFKCFENESLEFRNLTILTGTNGSGKSSVIQSLLLMSMHLNKEYGSPLGRYLDFLVNFEDIANFNLNKDKSSITLEAFDKKFSLERTKDNFHLGGDTFNEQKELLEFSTQNALSVETSSDVLPTLMKLSYSMGRLVFLSADRIGPQDLYNKNTNPLDRFGILGEYTISYLETARKMRKSIIEELCKDERNTLDSQVNYWLNHIAGTTIETDEIEGTTLIKARFKNSNASVQPKNMGSGMSYLVSMLVICLAAKKEQIIIIENPEIHLHPKAQSKLGEFFAFVASKGIQIIIETHNDHLINRLRYEVFSNNLNADDIIIHYKENNSPFEQIEITPQGKFNNKNGENSFPQGFYDATLSEIFAINRG